MPKVKRKYGTENSLPTLNFIRNNISKTFNHKTLLQERKKEEKKVYEVLFILAPHTKMKYKF